MKNNLKTVLRLLPYAMQFKLMTIFAGAMIVFGVLFKFLYLSMPDQYTILSDWFLLIVPMYLVQMVQSAVGLPGLMQSSGIKKAALTSASALLYEGLLLLVYTFIMALNGICLSLHPEAADVIRIGTLCSLVIMVLFTMYNVLAYRYYLVSMVIILIVAVLFGATGGFRLGAFMAGGEVPFFLPAVPFLTLPYGAFVAFGYGVTLLCGLLYYVLAKAFYKYPLSERVFRSALRRYQN